MAINNLNERVLQKEDVKQQVVEMLKDTKTDIENQYIETIKSLTPNELAALIHTNYYDITNDRRKPRQEMKPTEKNLPPRLSAIVLFTIFKSLHGSIREHYATVKIRTNGQVWRGKQT